MAFEQFKTQVLLLHSEQSTLDTLSAGFNGRFELHCATSGTEALHTLGVTPVDILVSAEKLPGMSGIDALREAKKRSPKTITILLAGSDTSDGHEALVSQKEIFQVVRGDMTAERLLSVVEAATQSAQLLALSESANDTSANVDKPQDEFGAGDTAENIIMETGEHGAHLISDGTGERPGLTQQQAGAFPTSGTRKSDLLVLTQDEEFLETVRQSSGQAHTIHHASKPSQAEDFVRNYPVGVLITDAALAGDNIEPLIVRIRSYQARLVTVVAGRRDDGEMLMDLINRGQVYRFLLKPVSPGRARLAIEASIRHHFDAPDRAFKGNPDSSKSPAKTAAIAKPISTSRTSTETPNVSTGPGPDSGSAKAGGTPAAAPPGLETAFGDSKSFTETVTDLAATVSKSLIEGASGLRQKPSPAPAAGTAKEFPHDDSDDSKDSSNGGSSLNVKMIGIAAVVLVAIGAGFLVMSGGPTDSPATTAEDSSTDTAGSTDASESNSPITESQSLLLLSQARDARAAGDLYSPAGRNAMEYYIQALQAEPDSSEISAEFEATVSDVYGEAEAALLENRTIDASRALRVIGLADAQNPRLAFLRTQLQQQQLRSALDDVRTAIRENRFEDAGPLLSRAETFADGNTAELEALSQELADARSAQQLDEVLTLAGERLAEDQLLNPSNDNARYYYQLSLEIDPDSSAAAQGLLAVASKLVLQARNAMDSGDLESADESLAAARLLDPNSAELMTMDTALNSARTPASAPAAAPDPAPAARSDPAPAVAAPSSSSSSVAAAEEPPATAQQLAASATPEPEVAAATAEPAPAPAESSAPTQNEFVSISSLKRTRYVPPSYPRIAQRRNLSGSVAVAFTVSVDGKVADVEIRESEPARVFDEVAIEAVEQWEFEPPMENGIAVPKRVAVRMSFNLQ